MGFKRCTSSSPFGAFRKRITNWRAGAALSASDHDPFGCACALQSPEQIPSFAIKSQWQPPLAIWPFNNKVFL
jgi:hypothetical protein